MLRKSTVTGPRESKFYQKPISRRFCFFEIKSNWSILNQIMVSLFLLTFLTLVFVTSQVILGLYISKYFFAQFTQEIIYNKTATLFENEAKIIQKTVNQPFTSPSQAYLIDNTTITKIAQQALSIPTDGNSSDSTSFQSDNDRFLLAGNNVYYPNNSSSTIVVMFVNMTDVSQYDDELQDETEKDFNANVLYTSYLIGGSFLLILLLGWCFAYYIVRPLKKLAEYAQHINNNTTRLTMGKMSKVKPIELEEIKAQDKIGELINEFKNLIQGLAGLKKGNV